MKLLELLDTELYHVMDCSKAINIFDGNKNSLPASWLHKIEGRNTKGTSFTRNKLFWFKDDKAVRLVVNYGKLKANNKLIPLDGEHTFHKTYYPDSIRIPSDRKRNSKERLMSEEFVVGDIKNLSRVLERIEVRRPKDGTAPSVFNRAWETIEEWCKGHNVSVTIDPKAKAYLDDWKDQQKIDD